MQGCLDLLISSSLGVTVPYVIGMGANSHVYNP